MIPVMSANEIHVLEKYLSKCKIYFEYGAGGSTCLASKYPNIQYIFSVESNQEWIDKVQELPIVKNRVDTQQIEFRVIDVNGNPRSWGYPFNLDKKENWPVYSSQISKISSDKRPDLVFIDGRFRVACIVMSLLSCSDDTIICVHDFNDRPHYHYVNQFIDVLEKVDTLIVFRKKTDANPELLHKLYDVARYDPK
jgi:hypothetical protein